MQHPSTYAGPRITTQRARRVISPINAAQRAGYGLDAMPVTLSTPPAPKTASGSSPTSTTAKAH